MLMPLEQTYLIHYGVKGMKWGVRREMGQRARAGGRLGREADEWARYKNRYDKKIAKVKMKGGSSDKIKKFQNKRTKAARQERALRVLQKKMYKGLSQKDIDKGKKIAKHERFKSYF